MGSPNIWVGVCSTLIILETLPYFRPKCVIFATPSQTYPKFGSLFQTCPETASVCVDIWEELQISDINHNTLLKRRYHNFKKSLLVKTIPNSRPDRTNLTLFQTKVVKIDTLFQKPYPLGSTYLSGLYKGAPPPPPAGLYPTKSGYLNCKRPLRCKFY